MEERRTWCIYTYVYIDDLWILCESEVEEEVRDKLGEWLGNESEGSWVMLSWSGMMGWCCPKDVPQSLFIRKK